jgi:hypothetical protein
MLITGTKAPYKPWLSSGGIGPLFLNFITPQPLYSKRKSLLYPFDRRLVWRKTAKRKISAPTRN